MELLPYYLGSALIGALVGTVEVFQRYKAEPLQAVTNWWGIFYIVFNAGASALGFYVVVVTKDFDATTDSLTKLQWTAVAGFGAVAFLHTKLINVNVAQGREVALGPEIVVQTFLSVIDRELDRARAKNRFETVHDLMYGIDFDRAKIRLPAQIFQAMQQVTEEETEVLMERIREIDETTHLNSQDKSYILGFYLLDLVGDKFLTEILPKYKDEFSIDPTDGGE